MSIKFTHHEKECAFFCTFTCLDWLPLFQITDLYDEIYKWLNILVEQKHKVVGFVIMPNHMHLLLDLTSRDYVINSVLANGKRFMAYEIVKRLQVRGHDNILAILSSRVTAEERKRKKKHRVFEVSSDIKPCYTERFLLQKLEYIHANPVSKKWLLANAPEQYPHSSASFYELNQEHPKVQLTHYEHL
ncbi:MAG TPA: hypothetical protein VGD40_06315 [Chryseosolibacter sp.]